MFLQEMTKERLPLIMQLVGDEALEEGRSPEEAFAAAHAALASLQAARIQGKLEAGWGIRTLSNLTKDLFAGHELLLVCYAAMVFCSFASLLATAASSYQLANLAFLIPYGPSLACGFCALIWPTAILNQGEFARRADRWLGESDYRASYIETICSQSSDRPYLERHYLVRHEALVDLVSAAVQGEVIDREAFDSNSTHLPDPLREKILQAIETKNSPELRRIRDKVLRPSAVCAAARGALERLAAAFVERPDSQRDFGLLEFSPEILQGIAYYGAL